MPEEELEPEVGVETPEVEVEPFVLPEDFASQVQSWELGLDDLPKAVETYKSLQTEEGIIDAFISTGQSLGFGLKELNKLFADDEPVVTPPAAPAAPVEELDPERLMTAAEVDAMLKQVREEAAQYQQTQEQRDLEAKQMNVMNQMNAWFDAKEVTDLETRGAIARFGEKHLRPGQNILDPAVAIAALEAGQADYDAWIDAEAKRYLAKKKAVADGQPTPPGGAPTSGGGGPDDAPKYEELGGAALQTAKDRVRARLRANGELS